MPDFKTNINRTISTVNTATNDLIDTLNKLDVTKSPGPDNLHPKLLKETSCQIAFPLKILFEKTLSLGKLPIELKKAEVRPIFKKVTNQTLLTIDQSVLQVLYAKSWKLLLRMPYINT